MHSIDRRRFIQGVGAAGAAAWASPWLSRLGLAVASEPLSFPQGVASGDPTQDAVILWTRYQGPTGTTAITWDVALDSGFSTIVKTGTAGVDPATDRTIKVDAADLDPGTTYWYRFRDSVDESATGRTRTASPSPTSLRMAVTSCQDFQAGFYRAWNHVAARNDLDFVLFLGDYIYEYADNGDGFRDHDPAGEILTLDDYRRRYRNYRSDADLREAHRRHPFISVWDDHEVANDRWGAPFPGGAENHNAGEGAYGDRLAAAMQAYFEYVPIRKPDPVGEPNRIYRRFDFGGLAELFALDTRSYRNEPKGAFFNPVTNALEPAFNDPNRTILGTAQKGAFKGWLQNSTATWKLVGNQVMIGSLNFASLPDPAAEALANLFGIPPRDGIPVNYDQWDGYQPERREILNHVKTHALGETVFLTGDIHTSWVHEVTINPAHAPVEDPVAVEFVGPSITSDNLNELAGDLTVGQPLPHGSSAGVAAAAIATNRQLRHVELDSNGYTLVDVNADRVLTEYHYVVAPLGSTQQPIRDPNSTVQVPVNGRWRLNAGATRVLPEPPPL